MGPLVRGIVDAIHRSPMPVYLFLPQVPSVRLLRKPGEAPSGTVP